MPTAPARLCSYPGCMKLEKHKHRTHYKERRGGSTARGYDAIWQKLRLMVLRNDPLCYYCGQIGLVVPADTVDHMTPLVRGGLRLARENLVPACKSCNSAKGDRTAEEFITDRRR